MRQNSAQPAVSIIVPIFNEEENLPHLYGEVAAALEGWRPDFELILIDDGSQDRSWTVIEELCKRDPRVKGVRFRGNFGQTAAVSAGFDLAEGELMVTMDGDLQNDPADIPALAESMETRDLDLVNGWRFHRKDPFLNRRLPSMIANGLISLITGVKLHDYGCSLKVYRKEIAKDLKLYGEQHRFIPALASLEGARVGEEKVNHRARRFGKSKYGISRTFRVVLDLITVKFLQNYSTKPLRIFGSFGLLTGGLGLVLGFYLAYVRLILQEGIAGRPLLFLAMLLLFLGVQFISLGLLGEMMARTYHESAHRRIYRIKSLLNGTGRSAEGAPSQGE